MSKHSKKKIKLNSILTTVFVAIILICIGYLIYQIYIMNANKNIYENIVISKDIDTTQVTENMAKVQTLQQENEDVKGWIKIDDTNINYPILQTTNNDYYLTHNYKKEKTNYGSIFMNSNCNIKDNNSNIIIYGHDMKDGQMFKHLLKYEDKVFYDEHSNIKIATEEQESNYKIISVFKSRVFYQDEKNVFRYYQYYNLENENKYNEYIENCKKIQLYDTGETATYGEQLITLITCEYSQKNGRMVVVAKKEI